MDKKELITEEIPLSEEGLKNKQLEKRAKEIDIYKLEREIEELELLLDKDVLTRQIKDSISDIKKNIENKQDEKGVKLSDADCDALKIRIKMFEKDLEQDITNKTVRVKLSKLHSQKEFEEGNLKTIEKQIRERKVISVHR